MIARRVNIGTDQRASRMYRSIVNICVLIVYYCFCIYYFTQLFWGHWNEEILRGVYYLGSALVTSYFIIDMMRDWVSVKHYHTTIVYFISTVIERFLFSIILFGGVNHPVFYLFLYNGLMIVVSLIILLNDFKHGNFKD